jgi:GWxTD domain-containing protein
MQSRGERLKYSTVLVSLVLFALVGSLAAPGHSQGELFGTERREQFELAIRQVFDQENRPVIIVTTSISNSRLVFLIEDEHYISRYRVFLELRPKKGRGTRGEVWEEAVTAENYSATQSSKHISTSSRRFTLDPGDYRAKVSIEVIDTSLRFSREKDIRIVEHGHGLLVISDPVFMIPLRNADEGKPPPAEMRIHPCGEDESFLQSPNAIYHGFNLWTRVSHTIVGPFSGDGLAVTARIVDAQKRTLRYNHSVLTGTGEGHLQLCLDFQIDNLQLGEYEIEISAFMPEGGDRARTTGRFSVLFTRSSFSHRFDQTLEILSIIADERELAELREVPPGERFEAWQRFWKKRDPTSSTDSNERLDDFLSRLSYVIRNFSLFAPGWQTDRGRVYIRHGRPDKISDASSGIGRSYQYWYYYSLGAVFIFEDPVGTGEYQLVSTELL